MAMTAGRPSSLTAPGGNTTSDATASLEDASCSSTADDGDTARQGGDAKWTSLLGWMGGKRDRDSRSAATSTLDQDQNKRRNSPLPAASAKKTMMLQCTSSEDNGGLSTAPVSSCSSVLVGDGEKVDERCEDETGLVFFGPKAADELDEEDGAEGLRRCREQLRVEALFTAAGSAPINIPLRKSEEINPIAMQAAQQSLRAMEGRISLYHERTRGQSVRPTSSMVRPARVAATSIGGTRPTHVRSVTLPVIYIRSPTKDSSNGNNDRAAGPQPPMFWPGRPSFDDPSPSACSTCDWFDDSGSFTTDDPQLTREGEQDTFGKVEGGEQGEEEDLHSPLPVNDDDDDLLFDLEDT